MNSRAIGRVGSTPRLERGTDRYRQLGPTDFLSDAEREFKRFRELWPYTAAACGLGAPPGAPSLFALGTVFHLTRYGRPVGYDDGRDEARRILASCDIAWRQYMARHSSGDFGLYGQHNEAPLTDEEVFTLAEQPVLSVNKASITAKAGPIRSRYALADSLQRERGMLAVLGVVTVLSPRRGPRTLDARRSCGREIGSALAGGR